jgi:hypothetical protein
MVHTDPLGKVDLAIPDNVRIYAFGGTQHGPAAWPVDRGTGQAAPNAADYRPLLRALLDRLDQWCRDGRIPPPSTFPTLRAKTLADWPQRATGFPMIPGVRYPEVIRSPRLLDFGDRWESDGIMDLHPPVRRSDYVVLVPRCGHDGNELGCVLPAEVAAPLATFTGWALRSRDAGAENDLVGLPGSYIPFPKTVADRESTGDPRESLAQRYGSLKGYLVALERECLRLQNEGFLLTDDIEPILKRQNERAEPLFIAQP